MHKLSSALLILLFMSGCAVRSGVTEAEMDVRKSEYDALGKPKIVSVVDDPYVRARPVRLAKNNNLNNGVFTQKISLNTKGSVGEICATVTEMTGLPIYVQGGAGMSAPSGDLDAELRAALAGSGGKVTNVASAIKNSSSSNAMKIKYSGTVKGLLDVLASRSGLSWTYSASSGVTFASANIRTFTIHAAPGKVGFSNKITNESKDTNSGSGASQSSQDISIQTAQTNTTDLTFDVWAEVEKEVKSMLSSTGSVTINQAAGTITVKDSAFVLQEVAQYVDEINTKLSRQIALSIKVWSLELDDSAEAGINLSLFFESPDIKVFAGASPLNFSNNAGELSAAIVDGRLKNSTALLKGLRRVGRATQVTSGGGVVMSNQPVPVQAIRREAYLASSSKSDTDYGQTTELEPGEVTTGFAMTVIPHILEGRRVILQYTVHLSNLDEISEFSSGDAKIQLPKVSSRSFSQRMTLKMGQTLVLAGFEQEVDSKNTSGGFLGFGRSHQYTKSLIIITISTESGDI